MTVVLDGRTYVLGLYCVACYDIRGLTYPCRGDDGLSTARRLAGHEQGGLMIFKRGEIVRFYGLNNSYSPCGVFYPSRSRTCGTLHAIVDNIM